MPLFNWPYTNLHNLNLDWIIKKIKNVETAEINTAASKEAAAGSAASASGSAASAAESETNAAASATAAAGSAQTAQNLVNQLDTTIAEDVEDWLNNHVTPTSPVVDDSLTISGAAADAKVTGDKITELKTALNDVILTTYSSNIFDQSSTTITEGKYLNPSNGNEGTNESFCHINEYMPIESEQSYIGSLWRKNDLSFVGVFNEIICFYDSSKAFISGFQVSTGNAGVFTTPAGAAYYRFSCNINSYTNGWFMIEKGTVRSAQFVPYSETNTLKMPFTIVDANGSEGYTSIESAVNDASDGAVILVMPGTYEENVKAWAKVIHIIGIDKDACILKDTSGNYPTPPLEIGAGSVQNMSIIEQAEGAGTANLGAYAVHVESNNLYNKKLLIRNCYIYSDSSSAIGMGLRGGCSVRIEDCELICAGARNSTGAAPLYFHDADAQTYWGTANLYLHGNVLRNISSALFSMLTINSIHPENTTYMHIMYNIFVRSSNPAQPQKWNTWNTSGNSDADGWNGLSHMYLTDDSFGNNQTDINHA